MRVQFTSAGPRAAQGPARYWTYVRRLVLLLACVVVAGCGTEVDPTPEKLDGTPSYEFEREDLETAEGASDAVKEYCSGAVSEAQRLGCESHVTESDIP